MTKIKLTRLDENDNGIFGKLSVNGFSCVTLERHDIAIPKGVYPVVMYDSPSHGYVVPLLKNVPKRDFIEIHCGNYERDSKGCILVGERRAGFTIENSRKAFAGLMQALKDDKEIQIEVC